jgi:hypothetical protein
MILSIFFGKVDQVLFHEWLFHSMVEKFFSMKAIAISMLATSFP